MSRLSSGPPRIEVKPKNNIYTVLAIIALVALIVGFMALYSRATALGVSLW